MCAGFQVLKDTEKSGKALALPFCKRFLRKLSASGRWTNRKTIRQTLSNRFWKSRKVQYLFLHNLPEKKKMNNTWDSQYLWVADRNAHEHSCPWTNKNIGNLKMMAENRTYLVASRRNKKKQQDYFEWSSFSTNPIGIHSKLPCHFFLISIQYISIQYLMSIHFYILTLKH